MEHPGTAYLDIRLSTEPEKIWRTVPLADDVTLLGRPEAGEPGVDLVYQWVSRKHAAVIRQHEDGEAVYRLEHRLGRGGTRLYATLMTRPGETQVLRHGYTFQIPGMLESQQEPHFRITLYVDSRQTFYRSIKRGSGHRFSIFGEVVDLTAQEYALLSYLYDHKDEFCSYDEILAAIWGPHHGRTPQDLHSLVSTVRRKIRQASGGVELIETIHGEGLCLRI